ncbi:MAG TPA: DNA polymerase I [Candidatus Binataceae bacterium]|nr:DNA polymerase I [Candidatus Binataceae bacterium]
MTDGGSTLYLVDGSGYIFRAFHALPQLNNSRGLPTNAVYGFVRMLLKLLKDAHPERLAIVFDSPRRTFRDDLFQDYKANRTSPPNDLVVQIPFIHRAVEVFRIKSLILPGYEADDLIGTLALRAARQRIETVIVTGDKDFMQLVGPHITLWDTMRDKRIGTREVREKLGVEPKAVVDLMALMGDSIDNVKGVPGVGEKTASALIQKFGTLDNLLARLDELERSDLRGAKKLAPTIAQHRDDVELARKLVRIDTDTPVTVELDELAFHGIDEKATAELLRELEFNSIMQELAPTQAKLPVSAAQEVELTAEQALQLVPQLQAAPRLAFDLKPDAGDNALKVKAEGLEPVYVFGPPAAAELKPLLEAPNPPRACHDLKSHLTALCARGIKLQGVDFDTMLAGFLINPGRAEPALEDLFHEHLAPLGGAVVGSAPEVVAALREVMVPRLERDGLRDLFHRVELPLASVLAEMEQVGIKIDSGALAGMGVEFGQQLHRLEAECFKLAGREFNLNSPNQLRDVLFTELKLPTKGLKKTKSGYSTDVDVLTKLAESHELPRKLLEYRTIAKLKSTYVDSLAAVMNQETGRLHTSFHQALTATGRLSSTDPNLQNIPTRTAEGRRIRRAFVADDGWVLLSADYSQIELRVLAHLSGDPILVDAFASGEDIHRRTATEVLGIGAGAVDSNARRLAKVINFGIIYGMGPQRLAGELNIPLKEASEYIERYFKRLPGVSAYLEECLHQARERGYVVTLLGRRRYLPELSSPQGGARAQAERIAINTPIQGTAADLIKMAMVRLHDLLRARSDEARMLLQVHDELLFEVQRQSLEEVSRMVREQMENVAQLRVSLEVELKSGPNWAELS